MASGEGVMRREGESPPCGRRTPVVVIICAVEDKAVGCEEIAACSEL